MPPPPPFEETIHTPYVLSQRTVHAPMHSISFLRDVACKNRWDGPLRLTDTTEAKNVLELLLRPPTHRPPASRPDMPRRPPADRPDMQQALASGILTFLSTFHGSDDVQTFPNWRHLNWKWLNWKPYSELCTVNTSRYATPMRRSSSAEWQELSSRGDRN